MHDNHAVTATARASLIVAASKLPMVRLAISVLALTPAALWAESTLHPSSLGAQIAQHGAKTGTAACILCHGQQGDGSPIGPRLAGLDAGYLARQLRDFRSGKRQQPVMAPISVSLTDEEISAVAGTYAQLHPAPTVHRKSAEIPELVSRGDWAGRELPACAKCHGPDGEGIGSFFPGLAGQRANYLSSQLKAWKSGARNSDPLGLMASVARRLTETEIETLSTYYEGLPWQATTPAPNAALPADDPGKRPGAYAASAASPEAASKFQPPARDTVPQGPFGDMVRLGESIFLNANRNPASAPYVGNDLSCANCHFDAGRLAGFTPLWAAWVAYPAYRQKTKHVDTFVARLQGCFDYSMNAQASAVGKAPATDSDVMVALAAYSYWLATGAATGDRAMPGRGYPPVKKTGPGFDPERGGTVYAQQCALCHGTDGAGVVSADGVTLFPALWGSRSYNWGAGMDAIDIAAAFIKQAMPLGLGHSLSDQDAWDVAAYMNSHERPQDPRFNGDLQDTAAKFHTSPFSLYGRPGLDGSRLGSRPARPNPAPAPAPR